MLTMRPQIAFNLKKLHLFTVNKNRKIIHENFDLILTGHWCTDQSQYSPGHSRKPQIHKLISIAVCDLFFSCLIVFSFLIEK